MMPAISLNWRRTSTTMDWAAFCTALMVKAEKTKVSMAPMNRPTRTVGLVRVKFEGLGGVLLHDVDIGHQQGQSGQGGGADGEALAGGGGGVAQGVQGVGALADLLRQAAHLGDAAGVVGHGAVGVGGQGDAQGGEHAHAGDADAVQALVEGVGEGAGAVHDDGGAAGGEVADEHGHGHDQDGGQGGLAGPGRCRR